ncbi:MAG TPA: STAS domain-containing protein [Solirubrobacteraceae bacterium]|nr:STAS domain-containing protein [Solirubrobacteraceae bacterium]
MPSPVDLDKESGRAASGVPIRVAERELDERTVEVAVAGELDLATAPHLKWPLLDALRAGRTNLLVNLSQVTFIDSTALSVLVGVKRKLPISTRMALVCTNESVLRIFTIAGLDGVFAIFPSVEDALEHLRGDSDRS